MKALYTSRAAFPANDSLDWGQLGPNYTLVNAPFVVTSTGGQVMTVSRPDYGQFQIQDEDNGSFGIPLGDHLLRNAYPVPGDEMEFFTTSFANPTNPISGFGTTISVGPAAFSATLTVFNDSTELGSVTVSNSNGLAQFVGITSEVADIDRVTISTNRDIFLIDALVLRTEATAAPEPVGLALLGTGLLGIGLARARRAA